ncbi:MAG TPA: dihydrofolate reductase family protein [Solirubrobacteraceae bacterium]|jgi:riboflavin-specific deaminase-like protein|nr:dihydrofolate reductase family protein [Solirubrobacteraceae bacterium]
MTSEPTPASAAVVASLLDGPARQTTAEQAVERLRLWDPRDAPPARGRPRVFLNMACTADGRAALQGRSGSIGNRADRELFHALRTAVDAVLVGAGTVRAERYGRLVRSEAHRGLRRARGLAEEPLACIVSASLVLPAAIPLLADPAARVVILTPSDTVLTPSGTGELAERPAIDYVRAARDGHLDLPAALGQLRARWGVRTVLCEGGPHLNGALLRAGVVDELFLSLAPKLAGGGEGEAAATLRIVCGPELQPTVALELRDVLESEGLLLLRYAVSR